MKQLKALIPESRKLRVMLLTLIGYVLNAYGSWLSPDQMYDIMMIVGGWLGVQGYADAGEQGKAIADGRRSKGQKQLDPKAIFDALKDKDISKADMALMLDQLGILADINSAGSEVAKNESQSSSTDKGKPEGDTALRDTVVVSPSLITQIDLETEDDGYMGMSQEEIDEDDMDEESMEDDEDMFEEAAEEEPEDEDFDTSENTESAEATDDGSPEAPPEAPPEIEEKPKKRKRKRKRKSS